MIVMIPASSNVKNSAPTHGGELFGFGLGGGCLRTRLDLLFGMARDSTGER